MHELSLVESLLEQVSREARARIGATVQRIEVRIGEASGVEAELFVTAFEQLRAGTACSGAELAVQRVPARFRCRCCQREFERGAVLFCEACSMPGELFQGGELMLDRIELEASHV